MIVNIQVEWIADLLWELHGELGAEAQREYASRVDQAASLLHHPDLDRDVLLSVGSDGAVEATGTLGGVVLPLKGLKVAD